MTYIRKKKKKKSQEGPNSGAILHGKEKKCKKYLEFSFSFLFLIYMYAYICVCIYIYMSVWGFQISCHKKDISRRNTTKTALSEKSSMMWGLGSYVSLTQWTLTCMVSITVELFNIYWACLYVSILISCLISLSSLALIRINNFNFELNISYLWIPTHIQLN